MSRAYNARKKALRKERDSLLPERKLIRRFIKNGKAPRWTCLPIAGSQMFKNGFYTVEDKAKRKFRVYMRWPMLTSNFRLMQQEAMKREVVSDAAAAE